MRVKSKHIGGLFMLRSVGDEAVDISFIMGDDRKSLPDELVSNSDHSEFTWLSVLPEPCVCLPAFSIEPAGIPRCDVEESSGISVSVSVDVPSDVYGGSGLFVSRADAEIPGHLLGVLEVSEASGGDDECRGERYPDALNGGQQRELSAELDFDKIREFRLKPVTPLFKELNSFIYGMDRTFIRDRQTSERASEIRHGRNLLGELTYDRSLLPEPQDCLTLYLEGLRIHLLSVESYEPSVDLVSLDRGEHGSGEVLYLQWVLHADSNSGDIEQVQQHCAIVSSSLHNTVDTAVFRESSDKLLDTSGRVVESADLPTFVGGVSYHECSFAHVDSNVPHGRSVFSFNDIAYILVHHCEYGVFSPTNYPDSDVKSMGSEHISRSRRPMKTRTYSIL